jgi:GTPase SAR1 family protein
LSEESLEFCANVEKHLQRSGAVNRFLANIVFVGLPGSGKSTLIARLLNLKGIDEMLKAHGSTGVMDGIITVDVEEDEASMHAANIGKNCEWHKVEFGISVLRQMGKGCFVLKLAPADHAHASPQESAESAVAAPVSEGRPRSPERSRGGDQISHDLAMTPAKQPTAKQTAKQSPENIMAIIQKLLGKEGFSAVRPFLNNKSSLYLSDTGE